MATAELEDLLHSYSLQRSRQTKEIKEESLNIQTCLKIGALWGKAPIKTLRN
jgi:hypothetical protein